MENEGVYPPDNLPNPCYDHPDNANLVYPSCKECGKEHGLGIINMKTGRIEPLDICNECLWKNKIPTFSPSFEEISKQMRINADIIKEEITLHVNKEIERLRDECDANES